MGKGDQKVIAKRKKIACSNAFPYNYAWLEFIDFSLIDYELRGIPWNC